MGKSEIIQDLDKKSKQKARIKNSTLSELLAMNVKSPMDTRLAIDLDVKTQ